MRVQTLLFLAAATLVALVARIVGPLLAPLALVSLLAAGLLWWRWDEPGERTLLVGLTIGLGATWLAGRPPWEAPAGALIWAGALLLYAAPRAWVAPSWTQAAIGALAAGLVGWVAAHGLGASALGAALALALVVPAGRLVAAELVQDGDPGVAGGWLAAVGLPLVLGGWGVAAAVLEGAFLWAALSTGQRGAGTGWALGGLAAGLGAWVHAAGLL